MRLVRLLFKKYFNFPPLNKFRAILFRSAFFGFFIGETAFPLPLPDIGLQFTEKVLVVLGGAMDLLHPFPTKHLTILEPQSTPISISEQQ